MASTRALLIGPLPAQKRMARDDVPIVCKGGPAQFPASALGSGVEQLDEPLRGDRAICILAEGEDLIPVDSPVEVHADPSPGTDIGRDEESLW